MSDKKIFFNDLNKKLLNFMNASSFSMNDSFANRPVCCSKLFAVE